MFCFPQNLKLASFAKTWKSPVRPKVENHKWSQNLRVTSVAKTLKIINVTKTLKTTSGLKPKLENHTVLSNKKKNLNITSIALENDQYSQREPSHWWATGERTKLLTRSRPGIWLCLHHGSYSRNLYSGAAISASIYSIQSHRILLIIQISLHYNKCTCEEGWGSIIQLFLGRAPLRAGGPNGLIVDAPLQDGNRLP